MRKSIFLTAILLYSITNAYASQDRLSTSFLVERLDDGNAASVRVQSGDLLYGGISINNIKSSSVIQTNDRKRIYPVFLFMGVQYPSRITPFAEAAVDLPEAIFDEIFDDEENKIDLTDYYLSAGFNIGLTRTVTLTLFARKYVFKYQDPTISSTSKVREDSYGAGVMFHF